MAKQPPKPPTARVSGLGAMGAPVGWGRLLTDAQRLRSRKRADRDAKLRQLTVAERERRR